MTSFRDYLEKRGLSNDSEFMARLSEEILSLPLAALREQAGVSQATLAKRLNKSQAAVSKFEYRNDFLLSTFHEYVEAIGGEVDIAVRVKEKTFELKERKGEEGHRYFTLKEKKALALKSACVIRFATIDGKRKAPASSWQHAMPILRASSAAATAPLVEMLLKSATEKAANDEAQSAAA